jgi:hypothetical protein
VTVGWRIGVRVFIGFWDCFDIYGKGNFKDSNIGCLHDIVV